MRQSRANQFVERRYVKPGFIFSLIFLFFQVIPICIIFLTGHYTDRWYSHPFHIYSEAALLGSIACIIFYLSFIVGWKINLRSREKYLAKGLKSFKSIAGLGIGVRGKYFLAIFTIISIIFSFLYFIYSGLDKILLFGSGLDTYEFRTYGWDNRSAFESAMVQITRRLILPFAFIYYFIAYNEERSVKYLFIYILSFLGILLTSISTLDRAPFMLAFVMLIYIKWVGAKNTLNLYLILILSVIILLISSGLLTFIQHGIVDFDILDVMNTGVNFLYNRAFLAASTVPVELSYGLFSIDDEKLYLRYSRLLSLLTGVYVGSFEDDSLYVGPVGAIADIWRNLGFFGVVFVSLMLGRLFRYFDKSILIMDTKVRHAFIYSSITFIFYLIYGNFFSQGVFLQLTLLTLVAFHYRLKVSRPRNKV